MSAGVQGFTFLFRGMFISTCQNPILRGPMGQIMEKAAGVDRRPTRRSGADPTVGACIRRVFVKRLARREVEVPLLEAHISELWTSEPKIAQAESPVAVLGVDLR
jgi:hypothetical protein